MNKFRGGFEGLHQKKWTHVAICAIKYAAELCSIAITQMGQGDNQIIIIHYTDEQARDRETVFKRFMATLEAVFNKINHKLKEQETWVSKHLHEYSKARAYKGVFCSRGTQKASKMIPDINDGLFSIPSSVATLNTMTESLAKADSTSDRAFIVNCILLGNFFFRKNLGYTESEVLRLLLWPADFGGMPLSNYQGHTIRGNDDKITLWLSILKTIDCYFPTYSSPVRNMWQIRPKNTPEDAAERTRLYEDIFSLNIKSLPSAKSTIRDLVLDYLKSDKVKNPVVRELSEGVYTIEKQELIETLDTMRPMNIQVASECLRHSNAGLLDQLQKRFIKTKSIEAATSGGLKQSFISLVNVKNQEIQNIVSSRLRIRNGSWQFEEINKMECPYDQAVKLREINWGLQFLELSKPPYQHQVILKNYDELTEEEKRNCITITISKKAQDSAKNMFLLHGSMKPYVGGSTHEKIRKPTLDISEKTSFATAALELGKIRSWMELIGAQNLKSLLDDLLKEKSTYVKTPEDVQLSELSAQVLTGNIFHRFMSSMEHSYAASNYTSGVTTHISQTSNSMATRTMGGVDISVFYQYVYVANTAEIAALGESGTNLVQSYGAVFECNSCTHILPTPVFDLTYYSSRSSQYSGNAQSIMTISMDPVRITEEMEVLTSLQIAKAIDQAYEKDHLHCAAMDKLFSHKENMVSVNDFRDLNFENILKRTIIYSRHCQQLVRDYGKSLLFDSDDLSFVPLAELIINSGLAPHLFGVMYITPTEHTMLTIKERLSAYISRTIADYTFRNIDSIVRLSLNLRFRRDINSNHFKSWVMFCCWLKQKEGFHFSFNVAKELRKMVIIDSVYKPIFQDLRIKPKISYTNPESVSMLWRASGTRLSGQSSTVRNVYPASKSSKFPRMDIEAYSLNKEIVYVGFNFPQCAYMSRYMGVVSSAMSKYYELLETVKLTNLNPRHIYCLAEGSAGTLATMLHMFPTAVGHYNTLINDEVDMRDDPSDYDPPAVKATGLLTRMHQGCQLASGTNNILSPRFQDKLRADLECNPPDIVTMDAEGTTESTNLEFTGDLLRLILSFTPKVVMFKLFLFSLDVLDQRIFELRRMYPNYVFSLIKPFTSNPVGREIFLVATHGTTLNEDEKRWLNESNFILSKSFLSKGDLEKYINISKHVADWGRMVVQDSRYMIKNKYEPGVIFGAYCNLRCPRFLDLLMETIDLIHSNIDNPSVFLVIRRSGITMCLYRLIKALLYVIIRRSCKTAFQTVLAIERFTIPSDFYRLRRETTDVYPLKIGEAMSCVFFHEWKDSKIFLRDENSGDLCNCSLVHRCMSPTKRENSLVVRLISVWRQLLPNHAHEMTKIVNTRTTVGYEELTPRKGEYGVIIRG